MQLLPKKFDFLPFPGVFLDADYKYRQKNKTNREKFYRTCDLKIWKMHKGKKIRMLSHAKWGPDIYKIMREFKIWPQNKKSDEI